MNNNLFVSCLDSRMEQETSWYSRFEIGPFQTGQALTIGNSLRRTLLADQLGVFLLAVEIDGAIHEYSRLEGIKEPILDILLNLRQVALIVTNDSGQWDLKKNQETLMGYFDIEGPTVVKAGDLKFPKTIECINPNQVIATLNRNASFRGRFLITISPNNNLKSYALGDPINFSNLISKTISNTDQAHSSKLNSTNWLYVNPIFNSIRRVNYAVEQFGDVWEQKEIVRLELWTNGTIHPRSAIKNACVHLANMFETIAETTILSTKLSSSFNSFKRLTSLEKTLVLGSDGKETTLEPSGNIEKISTFLDLDVANLDLSLKTYLTLKYSKIENLGNLLQYTKKELKNLTSILDVQLEEIDSALEVFGLFLLTDSEK